MKTRILRLLLLAVILAAACLPALAAVPGPRVLAEGESPEERTLREAITALGWPDTISRGRLYELEPDDETMFILWPPSSALRYLLRTKVSANNGGSYDDETIQYARILALGDEGGRHYIDKMVENGLHHSSYQGREGIVMRVGDQICEPGGLLGVLVEAIRKVIIEFLGELGVEDDGEPMCAEAAAGLITWTCGSHTFVVRDDTATGAEEQIAAALYQAAHNQGLCDLGDTLVILAGTNDLSGSRPLSHYQELSQDTNAYLSQNAYGRVILSYTFMDADGNAGNQDWYTLDGNMADYADRESEFAIAAVKKAFEGGAPRDELNLSRVIVVYAGPSQQATHDAAAPATLSTLCVWPDNGRWHEIEVGPEDARSTVYAGSLIMVAEEDGLGLWAHEVAHSLYSRHILWQRYNRISDRYNYQDPWGQYGAISNWGLMGSGNWWGDPLASRPVHMMSFTKEAAGWLSYTDAELGKQYTLSPLENPGGATTALKIDDPNMTNPEWYYLLEARQTGGDFGAPESAVVLYQVSWNNSHGHHVVNSLLPQAGARLGSGPGERRYERPTLSAGNGVTVYRSPSRRLEFTLHSESAASGYSAVVSADVYTPTNLVGATVAPASVPPPAAPPTVTANLDVPLPDIDLHAYDDQGRHVGLSYATGEYEVQIPGAVASGDLQDAEEWIYVPEGTLVRFEVSAHKTEQFLAANPAHRESAKPQKYEISYGRFDNEGAYTEASGGRGEVAAGETAPLESPDDPGLRYKPARMPGYGRNWPGDPALVILIGAILSMGAAGWIVGLVRR